MLTQSAHIEIISFFSSSLDSLFFRYLAPLAPELALLLALLVSKLALLLALLVSKLALLLALLVFCLHYNSFFLAKYLGLSINIYNFAIALYSKFLSL
jgi:hypothetical protein